MLGNTYFNLFMTPIIWEHLFDNLIMCVLQLKFVSKVKPNKNLFIHSFNMCSIYVRRHISDNFFGIWKNINLHLFIFSDNLLMLSHSCIF